MKIIKTTKKIIPNKSVIIETLRNTESVLWKQLITDIEQYGNNSALVEQERAMWSTSYDLCKKLNIETIYTI